MPGCPWPCSACSVTHGPPTRSTRPRPRAPTSAAFPAVLAEQTAVIAALVGPGLPGPLIARGAMMWTQLFGMVSFELFGQLRNSLDPADAFFDYTVGQLADFLGLAADPVS